MENEILSTAIGYAINHEVKCHPEYFSSVWYGEKTHEIRFNDRLYKLGQVVRLNEFNPDSRQYSGRAIDLLVTYIRFSGFGLVEGFCIFEFIALDHIGIKPGHPDYHTSRIAPPFPGKGV